MRTPCFQQNLFNNNQDKIDPRIDKSQVQPLFPFPTNIKSTEGIKLFPDSGLLFSNNSNQNITRENKQEKTNPPLMNPNSIFNTQSESIFSKINDKQMKNEIKKESNTTSLFGNPLTSSNPVLNVNLKEEKKSQQNNNSNAPQMKTDQIPLLNSTFFTGTGGNLFNTPNPKSSIEESNARISQTSLFKENGLKEKNDDQLFSNFQSTKVEPQISHNENLAQNKIPPLSKEVKDSKQANNIEAEQAVLKDLARRNNPDKSHNILFENIKDESTGFMNSPNINVQDNSSLQPSNPFIKSVQSNLKETSNSNLLANNVFPSLFSDESKKLFPQNIFSNLTKKDDTNRTVIINRRINKI